MGPMTFISQRSALGSDPRDRWRLGSVADKFIRAAACDTLVIGPKATPFQMVNALLAPLDGSHDAEGR